MNLSEYKEDTDRQNNGVKIRIDDAIFTIRRFGTKESDKFMADLRKKKANPFEVIGDGEKQHIENEIFGEWLAKYAVTDWTGVYGVDDEEIPYSKKAAWEIFTDPEYYLSLNNALITKAIDVRNYLHIKADEVVEHIKPRIDFDVRHPTQEEKHAYIRHCEALSAEIPHTELTDLELELLYALYRADRNRDKDSNLKDSQIIEQVELVPLEQDICLTIIQQLDSHLLQQRSEKIKRESK